MKQIIVTLIVLLLMPTSITLAAKGGNKPDNNNSVDLESRVQNLEDRLQNSDLDNDGFTPAEGDCNDADASINPDMYEVIDNIDNNCDGLIDDCESAQEFCDGIDNNCDGQVDEGFDLGSSCSVGIGECRSTGVLVCSADGLSTECDATPGTPRTEICDGRDNDCDGLVDDNIAAVSTEDCCSWYAESYCCIENPFGGCLETCYRDVCNRNYTKRCIYGSMQNVCY